MGEHAQPSSGAEIVYELNSDNRGGIGSLGELKAAALRGSDIQLGLHYKGPAWDYHETLPAQTIIVRDDVVTSIQPYHLRGGQLDRYAELETSNSWLAHSSDRTYVNLRLPLRSGVKKRHIPHALFNEDVYQYWRWFSGPAWRETYSSKDQTSTNFVDLGEHIRLSGQNIKFSIEYDGAEHIVSPAIVYYRPENEAPFSAKTYPSMKIDFENEKLIILDFIIQSNGLVSVRKEAYDYYHKQVDLPQRVARGIRRLKNRYLPIRNLSEEQIKCEFRILERP